MKFKKFMGMSLVVATTIGNIGICYAESTPNAALQETAGQDTESNTEEENSSDENNSEISESDIQNVDEPIDNNSDDNSDNAVANEANNDFNNADETENDNSEVDTEITTVSNELINDNLIEDSTSNGESESESQIESESGNTDEITETFKKSKNTSNTLAVSAPSSLKSNNITLLSEENENDIWSYTSVDGGIAITGYKGSERDITIPSLINGQSVVSIGYKAFYGNKTITSVSIPDSVTFIGVDAFNGCISLASVNLPNTLETMGTGAFYACTSLKEITIPASFSKIDIWRNNYGDGALIENQSSSGQIFENCTSLKKITYNSKIVPYRMFLGCKSLTEINFSDETTTINWAAFSGCTSLSSVILGKNITSIGGCVFDGCKSLSDVYFDSSLNTIGSYAFRDCTLLESIVLPKSLIQLDSYAFKGCTLLSDISFNEGLKTIGSYAFEGCISIQELDFPSSLVEIGYGSFQSCTSLKILALNEGLVTVDSDAFRGCTAISSVKIPSTLNSIGEGMFRDCVSIADLTIPSGVQLIKDGAFYNCSSIKEVIIPSTVTDIEQNAFYGCKSIKDVTFNKGLLSLNNNSFGACSSLSSIKLPATVTNIYGAFRDCTSLKSIELNDNLLNADYAFYGCTSLEEATVPSKVTNSAYMFYGCTNLKKVIANNATYIGAYMFYNCENLSDVTLGNKITTINDYAFENCKSLSKIILPETLVTVGYAAFRSSGLADVTFNNGLVTIGSYAFQSCDKLEVINIPSTVTTLNDCAFQSCGLSAAIFEGTPPSSFSTTAFAYEKSTFKIFYKNAKNWSNSISGYFCFPYPKLTPAVKVSNVKRTGFDIDVTGVDVAYPLVKVAVWSGANGNDDLKYYSDVISYNAEENQSRIGTINVSTASHNDDTGIYNIAVYYGNNIETYEKLIISTTCNVPTLYDSVSPVFAKTEVVGGYDVKISANLSDAKIYYTVDGTEPTNKSTLYEAPLFVDSSKTIKAITVKEGYFDSNVEEYEIKLEKAEAPVILPLKVAGGYSISFDADSESKVYYTTDGTEPTLSSNAYNGEKIVVYKNTAIKAVAAKKGMEISKVAKKEFTFDENSPTIRVEDARAVVGGYIDVPVKIINNEAIASFGISLAYDSSKLTPVSYEAGSKFTSMLSNMDEYTGYNPLKFQWDSTSDVKGDEILFTVRFSVNKGQSASETEITVDYNVNDILNSNLDNINPLIDNGKITIVSIKKGDLSNDSDISNKDVLMLRRIVAGYSSKITDEEFYAADVVVDGVLNNKDVLLLRKYIAGYSVVLE